MSYSSRQHYKEQYPEEYPGEFPLWWYTMTDEQLDSIDEPHPPYEWVDPDDPDETRPPWERISEDDPREDR